MGKGVLPRGHSLPVVEGSRDDELLDPLFNNPLQLLAE